MPRELEVWEIKRIRDGLNHWCWRSRQKAAENVGRYQLREFLSDIMKLTHEDDHDVRFAAVETLGIIGNAESIPILKEIYKIEHIGYIQDAILQAIEKLQKRN